MLKTCFFHCKCIMLIKIKSTPAQKCVNNVKFGVIIHNTGTEEPTLVYCAHLEII